MTALPRSWTRQSSGRFSSVAGLARVQAELHRAVFLYFSFRHFSLIASIRSYARQSVECRNLDKTHLSREFLAVHPPSGDGSYDPPSGDGSYD